MEHYFTYLNTCKDLIQQLNELIRLQKSIITLSKYLIEDRKEKEAKLLELKKVEEELNEFKRAIIAIDFFDFDNYKEIGRINLEVKRFMNTHRLLLETIKSIDYRIESGQKDKIKLKEVISYQSNHIKELTDNLIEELPTLEELPRGSLIDNVFRELCLYIKEKITNVVYSIKLKSHLNIAELSEELDTYQNILISLNTFVSQKSILNHDQEQMLEEFLNLFYQLLINRKYGEVPEELGNECNYLYENLLSIYRLREPKDLMFIYNEEENVTKKRIKNTLN